ncbi:MAG: cytochrome c nitrite reductase small subunit [Paludibacter sp.]|nr:cytochrome c nitrite reductase small subunit [Paludibacter sp.]
MIAGLGTYTIYMSKAHMYLSDDPAACVNCHIMTPYYQTWFHNSHSKWTNCNDCHVPQNSVISKYYFKAMDGLLHSAVFTMRTEPLAIRARNASSNVVMDNCIRCHTQLNNEFVKTGMISFNDAREGKGKACWDCHTSIAHGKESSIASTPNAIVTPLPESPIPEWLKKAMAKPKE